MLIEKMRNIFCRKQNKKSFEVCQILCEYSICYITTNSYQYNLNPLHHKIAMFISFLRTKTFSGDLQIKYITTAQSTVCLICKDIRKYIYIYIYRYTVIKYLEIVIFALHNDEKKNQTKKKCCKTITAAQSE